MKDDRNDAVRAGRPRPERDMMDERDRMDRMDMDGRFDVSDVSDVSDERDVAAEAEESLAVLGPPDAADERLARLLRDVAPHYREPPPPPVAAMWQAIESAHFGSPGASVAGPRIVRGWPARRMVRQWGGPAIGMAAGLLLGVGFGARLWRNPAADAPAAVAQAADVAGPARLDPTYEAVTTQYFDQAVALFASLPAQLHDDRADARLVAQARDLLSTTRLLLDSPAAGDDPDLRVLLDDLELVLAQVVRVPAVHDSAQATLINEAIEARDVLPRLRTAAAQASAPLVTRSGDE